MKRATPMLALLAILSAGHPPAEAIETIPGVKGIEVSMESGTATVVYNDVATDPTELAEAIANAGYPAWPIKQ
jgi:copper chaperone CopZ